MTVELLTGFIRQSFVLGFRIALPLVAITLSVDIALAFAGRGSGSSLNSSWVAARAGVGLLVIVLALTRIPEVMSATAMSAINTLSQSH